MDRAEYLLSQLLGPNNKSKQNNVQLLISMVGYDGSGIATYIGFAFQGSATSEAKWRIEKLTYDGSGNYTGSTYSQADQVWDDRASLTYT